MSVSSSLLSVASAALVSDIVGNCQPTLFFFSNNNIVFITFKALAISTDFTGMVISCVIYGLGIGGITGLQVVVIVQSLGMDKLASAFGLNLFIGGLVVFPGIIIIGSSINA